MGDLFNFGFSAIVLLGVLVFVHEAGHFIVGRYFGIGVEAFSLGFGPALLRFNRKGTVYQVGLIPLGGYVKFYGTTVADQSDARPEGKRFDEASVMERSMTLLAGPIANFIFAVILFTGMVFYGLPRLAPVLGTIRTGSPAAAAGLEIGDQIVSVDGHQVESWNEFQKYVSARPGESMDFAVKRQDQVIHKKVNSESVPGEDVLGREGQIGIVGVSPNFSSSVLWVSEKNSPAFKAGFKNLDVVQAVGETKLKRLDLFAKALQEAKNRGDSTVAVQVLRQPGDQSEKINLDISLFDGNLASLGLAHGAMVVKQSDYPDKIFPGDVLATWNGQAISDFFELSNLNQNNKLSRVKLGFIRNFELVEVDVDMKSVDVQKAKGRETLKVIPADFALEMIPPELELQKYSNPLEALWFGISITVEQSWNVTKTLGLLVTGQFPLKALGGPIMMAKVAGDSAERGIQVFLTAMALISLNLGVVNLFPIPVLDGGQLLLCFIEGVRRKKPSMETIENFQRIGFVMVMSLVILATYNDISRFWASILKKIGDLL